MDDVIYRQDAIDVLEAGAELLRRVSDDTDIANIEREKYKWGLDLIEAYISDMKEFPSAQPEHNPDDERKIADLHKMVNRLYSQLKKQFICVEYLLSWLKHLWVPVTEELPKENGEYMVTVEYFGWHGEKGRMSTKASYTKAKGWCISDGKVAAWMPLPEPYFTKEES